MKKIFILIIVFALSIGASFAKNYTINFNGDKYYLLYSTKSKDFGGYLNEYYKKGETYNIWTELVAVHHFPNAYSPIDRIKDFKDYLSSMHVPSSLTFDDKKNTAMIDFIIISDKRMPIVLEFNIFKYEKSKKCGSIAIQYAKRYSATTTLQIEEIKREFEKNRKQTIKAIKKFNIPEVITQDIDKCISASDIIQENKLEIEKEQNKLSEDINNKDIENTDESENRVEISDVGKEEIAKEDSIIENFEAKEEQKTESKISDGDNISSNDTDANKNNINTTSDKLTINTDENKKEEGTSDIANYAPIPNADNIIETQNKHKQKSYQYVNNKDEYISHKRTKKELKAEVKQKRIEQKKEEIAAKKSYKVVNNNSELIAKPRTKKEIKQNNKKLKKAAKERLKQAKQKLNE